MATDETIRDAIRENAVGPRKHSESEAGASTEQHSLADQIAADKHISENDALSGGSPLRRLVHRPPPPSAY